LLPDVPEAEPDDEEEEEEEEDPRSATAVEDDTDCAVSADHPGHAEIRSAHAPSGQSMSGSSGGTVPGSGLAGSTRWGHCRATGHVSAEDAQAREAHRNGRAAVRHHGAAAASQRGQSAAVSRQDPSWQSTGAAGKQVTWLGHESALTAHSPEAQRTPDGEEHPVPVIVRTTMASQADADAAHRNQPQSTVPRGQVGTVGHEASSAAQTAPAGQNTMPLRWQRAAVETAAVDVAHWDTAVAHVPSGHMTPPPPVPVPQVGRDGQSAAASRHDPSQHVTLAQTNSADPSGALPRHSPELGAQSPSGQRTIDGGQCIAAGLSESPAQGSATVALESSAHGVVSVMVAEDRPRAEALGQTAQAPLLDAVGGLRPARSAAARCAAVCDFHASMPPG
jgi:hypothetical protein